MCLVIDVKCKYFHLELSVSDQELRCLTHRPGSERLLEAAGIAAENNRPRGADSRQHVLLVLTKGRAGMNRGPAVMGDLPVFYPGPVWMQPEDSSGECPIL
jgi:hypothetical protein